MPSHRRFSRTSAGDVARGLADFLGLFFFFSVLAVSVPTSCLRMGTTGNAALRWARFGLAFLGLGRFCRLLELEGGDAANTPEDGSSR